MSKNNFEILTEVYSGTSIGERIKKREQVISDYLNVYGQTHPEQGAETNPCDGTPCQEIQLFSLWCLEDTEGSRNISWAFKSCGISK